MTASRTCPRCTCVICIPVVDGDHRPTGWWKCTNRDCGVEWQERDLVVVARPACDTADIERIRGGRAE